MAKNCLLIVDIFLPAKLFELNFELASARIVCRPFVTPAEIRLFFPYNCLVSVVAPSLVER